MPKVNKMPKFASAFGAIAAAFLTAACVPIAQTDTELGDAGTDLLKQNPCSGPAAPICLFINAPVILGTKPFSVPTRKAQFFKTQATVEFVDNQKRRWVAPEATLTDGASIPKIFIPIVGDPTSREFLGAATLHDAYCGIGNEELDSYHARRWQEVHRMFYDTLIVGGTPDTTAKIMFAAVYLAGPRWRDPVRDLRKVPVSVQQAAMKQAKAFIEKEKPDLNSLHRYLDWLEETRYRPYRGLREGGGDLRQEMRKYSPEDHGSGDDGSGYDPTLDPASPSTPTTLDPVYPSTPTPVYPSTPGTGGYDPAAGYDPYASLP